MIVLVVFVYKIFKNKEKLYANNKNKKFRMARSLPKKGESP